MRIAFVIGFPGFGNWDYNKQFRSKRHGLCKEESVRCGKALLFNHIYTLEDIFIKKSGRTIKLEKLS